MTQAHHVAWILTYGPIPNNLLVLHHCDNPGCCNPLHLFLGTQRDNVIDMFKKNRQPDQKGEKGPSAKLNENQVKEIRTQLINGIRQRSLAKKYGVGQQTISHINTGRSWSHV